ncbi:GNAT family N-acetyltransferase [Brachybacterium huguangmaarense]
MSEHAIDVPVPEDAPDLADVHVRAWRSAYAGLLPPTHWDEDARGRRAEQWRRALRESTDEELRATVRVARRADGRVVGFLRIGEPRDPDAPVGLELQALNVAPEAHGTGAAQALVAALLGHRSAYLWVADPNPRAQAFYAKLGFAPDGAVTTDDSLAPGFREIRMVR